MTFSVRPPTCSVMSICAVAPTRRTISSSAKGVNPDSSARTSYGPGTSPGIEKVPSLPLTVSRGTPLPRWMTLTVAPGQHGLRRVHDAPAHPGHALTRLGRASQGQRDDANHEQEPTTTHRVPPVLIATQRRQAHDQREDSSHKARPGASPESGSASRAVSAAV